MINLSRSVLSKSLFLSLVFILAIPSLFAKTKLEQSVKGVFDLSNHNFSENGSVVLEGDWELYWNKLLTPDDFLNPVKPKMTSFFSHPGFWKNQKINETEISTLGYGTYRAVIKLPKEKTNLQIKLYECLSSCLVFVDGKKAIELGKVGSSKENSSPDGNSRFYSFQSSKDQIELVMQVSNFFHRDAGIYIPLTIGSVDTIQTAAAYDSSLDSFVLGSIFVMGFYHLALFMFRRKYKTPFYFGLFCLAIGSRTMCAGDGDFLYLFLPNLDWEWTKKIEYIAFYIGIGSFAHYTKAIYPDEVKDYFLKFIWSVVFICTGYTLVTRALYFTDIIEYFQIATLVTILYLTTAGVKAILRKRDGAWIYASGVAFLFLGTVNDILMVHGVIPTIPMSHFGLLAFIFAQSALLSRRFSNAFAQVEEDEKKINQLNRELVEKERARTLFFHNTSHELRTPLNGIIGFVNLFREGTYGQITPKMDTQLNKIQTLSNSLKNQVNTILDLAKSNNGELELNNILISPDDIVEQASTLGESLSTKDSDTTFVIEKSWGEKVDRFIGDSDKVSTIVRNLVGNAFKFKDPKRENHVSVFVGVSTEGIEIKVKDTGIGIPEEYQTKIFEEFEQVNKETNRSYEGTGLGLAMVKKIIDLMGGEIKVESKEGSGSTFLVRLPNQDSVSLIKKSEDEIKSEEVATTNKADSKNVATSAELDNLEEGVDDQDQNVGAKVIPLPVVDNGVKPYKILVVDDNEVNIEVIADLLISRGYPVTTALGGKEALESIRSDKPDLVLLDLMMPEVSGEDVLRELKNSEDTKEIPVILLTARASQEDRIIGLTMGADDYLAKPIISEEILIRVKNLLSRLDLEREKILKDAMQRQNEIVSSLLELGSQMQFVDDIDSFLEGVIAKLNDLFEERSFGLLIEAEDKQIVKHMAFSDIAETEKNNILNHHHKIETSGKFENEVNVGEMVETTKDSISILYHDVQKLWEKETEGQDEWLLLGGDINGGGSNGKMKHSFKLFIKGHRLDKDSLDTIKVFADQVIGASRNKLLTTELDRMAHTDMLTGAYNRAFFELALNSLIKQNKQEGTHFSILMCDVNGLKEINDSFGHEAGDALIKKSYETLKTATDTNDIVVRLGGDEFVVLSPHSGEETAKTLFSKIRKVEADQTVTFKDEITGREISKPVHMSIGLATTASTASEDLLKEADKLMYADKEEYYKSHQKYRA